MGIFSFGKKSTGTPLRAADAMSNSAMAELALNVIQDGVIIVDRNGIVRLCNPAAAALAGISNPKNAVGLDYLTVLKLANNEGAQMRDTENPVVMAVRGSKNYESRDFSLIQSGKDRQVPIYISVLPTNGILGDRIITFRDITKELEEDNAQTEFISTASHEMRTPVASIEGYLGIALNPQTATIDDRARKYLEEAHAASKHLGRLFQDLLDVTKLDDGRVRMHLVPLEAAEFVHKVAEEYIPNMQKKQIKYVIGGDTNNFNQQRKLDQVLYTFADTGFLHEILSNLIENAFKYTGNGGTVQVNARGEGDRVVISVSDTGIGIAPDDVAHIFQKFYRVDNSQTRTIGGTGLGLYLVKERTESMGGRAWVESTLGSGSTFYISLPRLSSDEYEKRRIAIENEEKVQAFTEKTAQFEAKTGGIKVAGDGTSDGLNAALLQPARPIPINRMTDYRTEEAAAPTTAASQAAPAAQAPAAAPAPQAAQPAPQAAPVAPAPTAPTPQPAPQAPVQPPAPAAPPTQISPQQQN
ncbi:PAS domain-containing protein [Candidatus Saccharibacteria bacterium]|nr:PAS domain-containing protein [Candidatus Saccharibacteria bacterium]